MAKSAQSPTVSQTAVVAVPNYEVKLFLDPSKVLTVESKPNKDADRVLNLRDSNRKIAMQFLDAHPHQLHQEGWNARFRRFEDSDEPELSYKRRYKIEPGQLAAALAAGARDGFTAAEKDYAAQVEWGFERQTLSFTRKKEFKAKGVGELELPPVEDLRSLAVREIPGKLDRVKSPGWARQLLAKAHPFGPVLGKRWEGDWQGPELSFEVWMIRTQGGAGFEPVVELSFKEKTQADAEGFREKLMAFVRDQDWLIEDDRLKTAMILQRY
jgi:hypothetical protein